MITKRIRLTIALASLCLITSTVDAKQRPNILWISCEDISPHLGCYGYRQAKTPVLDDLATQGVRYSNAFVTAGVCAPCRSGIITGMYQTTLGTHHMRCRAQLPADVRLLPELMREAGYFCTNNSKTDYQITRDQKGVWDRCSSSAHWRDRPDKDQPFFSIFNFTGCHESGIASEDKYRRVTKNLPAAHRHDASMLELPPYYPDTARVREDWKRYFDVISAMDANTGEILSELEADGLSDNTIVMYWSDHGVGLPRAKRWLYDSGMHIPLIVRVPEDFRMDGQGTAGTVNHELVSSVDFAPTVLNLAGVQPSDSMQGRAFLGDDLAAPRRYVFGARDRMDERYDIIRAVRDQRFKYIRNYEAFKTYYQYMNTPEKGATMREIRRVAALGELPKAANPFMSPNKPVEELYDLEVDPHELNNLAGDESYREQLNEMREAHLDWVLQTNDLGLIPEPEIVRREQQYGNRRDILHKADPDLMRRLRSVSSAALHPRQQIETLRQALNDSDPAVRYWGAIGLGNAGMAASPAKSSLDTSLGDHSPSVRIAAARALMEMDVVTAALRVLMDDLQSDEEWVRLSAAIILDEADEQARPAVPVLRKALKDRENKYVVRVANRALNELLGTSNQVP
ncbi:MAG: sulfatase-like hydrolase/transferase [Planctomycetota bacterium]